MLGADTGREQRLTLGVARKGEEQRRNDRIQRGFVIEPLVDAVPADRLPGVERRDVCAGGRRKLRGELRHAAPRDEPAQERVILELLEEAPAERVHEEYDHVVVLAAHTVPAIRPQGRRGASYQEPAQQFGDVGKAPAAVAGHAELAGGEEIRGCHQKIQFQTRKRAMPKTIVSRRLRVRQAMSAAPAPATR